MKRLMSGLGLAAIQIGAGSSAAPPVQPWAGAAIDDWTQAPKAVVLTDMSECRPASALSLMKLRKAHWKVIPYETTDGLVGKMVWAAPEAAAPRLSLLLGVEGWYAIFVGLFSVTEAPTTALLQLNTDPAPVSRRNARGDYGSSEEILFKVAKLDKSSLLDISQQSTGFISACGVTHVKLIPLSSTEIERIDRERRDTSHRRLIATYDGFTDLFCRSPRTAEAVLSAVEIFRDTDFGTLILQSPGADKVNYASKIGHMKGTHAEEYPRVGDRHFVEAIEELARKKVNLLQVLIQGAHDVGMKVHVGIRPAGWSFFEPYSDYWESPFYREHPEWRCVDRDGTAVARMSWAVPEVRKHFIDLLREQVRFGADGAHVVFNRGYPVVLYEPSAVQLFQEKHGEDPRQVEESDPRILEWRADVVTAFLRELRSMLDEEGERRGTGERLALSIMVLGTAQDDLRYGVDVRRLVAEGLVDEISMERGFGRSTNLYNLEFFHSVCHPKGVPFSPGITRSEMWYPEVPSYYAGGAAGVALWDPTVGDIFEWLWVARFGHEEETRWRLENLALRKPPRTIHHFRKLGDQIRGGRFGPFWGG